jgi:hypothetical protein
MPYPEFEELRSGNSVFSGMLAAQNEVSELDIFPGGNVAAQPVKALTYTGCKILAIAWRTRS